MKPRRGEIMLPFVVLAVGIALVYLGIGQGAGLAWASGGIFFIALGISALVLSLANSAAGQANTFLHSKALSVMIILVLMILLVVTVILGVLGK